MKTIFFSFCLFLSLQGYSQNGKLKKAKESLKETTTTTSGTITTSSSSSSSKDDTVNPFSMLFFKLGMFLTYGLVIESTFEKDGKMHDAEIAYYPYKNKKYGSFIYTDSINYALARVDISTNFIRENKQLYGNNLSIDIRFLQRLGFEVNYLQLYEKTNNGKDSFSLYTTMLNYHRIRTQKFDFWFGLGTMYVGNDVRKFGFSYGFGAEWFVAKPISVLTSIKASQINNRDVNTVKFLVKYHLKNYHISTGYEGFRLGASKINSFSIGIGASF